MNNRRDKNRHFLFLIVESVKSFGHSRLSWFDYIPHTGMRGKRSFLCTPAPRGLALLANFNSIKMSMVSKWWFVHSTDAEVPPRVSEYESC